MSFGDLITDIRVNKNTSLRQMAQKLKKISLEKYSKIERGIQNPKNQEEFLEIINALEINDLELIKKLEKKAMEFIPIKKMSEKDILKYFPAFIPTHIKTEEELKLFIKKMKKLIEKENSPS